MEESWEEIQGRTDPEALAWILESLHSVAEEVVRNDAYRDWFPTDQDYTDFLLAAWTDLEEREAVASLIDLVRASPEEWEEEFSRAGLRRPQLTPKLRGVWEAIRLWRAADAETETGMRIRRKKRWFKRLLRVANTVLGSIASAVPVATLPIEALLEFKETVENAIAHREAENEEEEEKRKREES